MDSDELEGAGAIVILLSSVVVFLAVVVMGSLSMHKLDILEEDMESVGIERFVRCNNSQSNWVEIVWKEKK